jgi:hypothetical protein
VRCDDVILPSVSGFASITEAKDDNGENSKLGVNEMLHHPANHPYQTAAASYVLLIEKRRADPRSAALMFRSG